MLTTFGRGKVLCLGPGADNAQRQAAIVEAAGCAAVQVPSGLTPADIDQLTGFDAVISWAEDAVLCNIRKALARKSGPLIPLFAEADLAARCTLERHICIDTTAAGGNASLLASV